MAGKAAVYARVGTAEQARRGPLWALVARWEERRNRAREVERAIRAKGGDTGADEARRAAYDCAAAELAHVLNAIDRGEA